MRRRAETVAVTCAAVEQQKEIWRFGRVQVNKLPEPLTEQTVRKMHHARVLTDKMLGGRKRAQQIFASIVGDALHAGRWAPALTEACPDLSEDPGRSHKGDFGDARSDDGIEHVADDRTVRDWLDGGRTQSRARFPASSRHNHDGLA
jgi:hypothetical protein